MQVPARGQRGAGGPRLVEATGQAWKVTTGIRGLVIAAFASVAQFFVPAELKTPIVVLAVATGAIGITALVAVRCPRCGRSLGGWAFRTGSLTSWHEALVELRACPHCGLRPPDDAGGRR